MSKLQKIEDVEESCQEKVFQLIYELDENVEIDESRIKSLRSISDQLRLRVKTNSKEVKIRVEELLREFEENKPMSTAEKEAMELKKKKTEDDKKAVLKEVELKSKDCEELTVALDKEKEIEEFCLSANNRNLSCKIGSDEHEYVKQAIEKDDLKNIMIKLS